MDVHALQSTLFSREGSTNCVYILRQLCSCMHDLMSRLVLGCRTLDALLRTGDSELTAEI